MAKVEESKFAVTVTPTEIVNQRPDGKTQRVGLEDLRAIILETNDSGPFAPDVWWFFIGRDPNVRCVFPIGASGEDAALKFAQTLPGFDNDALIQAMLSTENQHFVCWLHPDISREAGGKS